MSGSTKSPLPFSRRLKNPAYGLSYDWYNCTQPPDLCPHCGGTPGQWHSLGDWAYTFFFADWPDLLKTKPIDNTTAIWSVHLRHCQSCHRTQAMWQPHTL